MISIADSNSVNVMLKAILKKGSVEAVSNILNNILWKWAGYVDKKLRRNEVKYYLG